MLSEANIVSMMHGGQAYKVHLWRIRWGKLEDISADALETEFGTMEPDLEEPTLIHKKENSDICLFIQDFTFANMQWNVFYFQTIATFSIPEIS